jgi:hypothetical protein
MAQRSSTAKSPDQASIDREVDPLSTPEIHGQDSGGASASNLVIVTALASLLIAVAYAATNAVMLHWLQ